ncbi:hypothetical protein ACWM35_10190 [Neobacillus sp. K501]
MKIEICESMILSWLRHIQHCQAVPVKLETGCQCLGNAQRRLDNKNNENYKSLQEGEYLLNIFNNNQSHSQFFKQGEIDVLGLIIRNGSVVDIYGSDTAFHENGLN